MKFYLKIKKKGNVKGDLCMYKKGIIYEHCGHDKFEIDKFEYIKNDSRMIPITKPANGGLWASPEKSIHNWKSISDRQQDRISFKFRISDTAKVLEIEKKEDLKNLPRLIEDGEGVFNIILDFEKISKKYDVIYCNAYPGSELDKVLPKWDCECILVMNPDVVIL